MQDDYTQSLMGFRLCPFEPTARDVLLTLRWSIWHYGAPWWNARGAPDILVVSESFQVSDHAFQRVLRYLQTRLVPSNGKEMTDENHDYCQGFPDDFGTWVKAIGQRSPPNSMTLADLRTLMIDYVYDFVAEQTFSASTPSALVEQHVSLPWSRSIAATLLLPSGGTTTLQHGKALLWGVPFDASSSGLDDGTSVDVRYDPDDARSIYIIADHARIASLPAWAFEHHIPWVELVNELAMI